MCEEFGERVAVVELSREIVAAPDVFADGDAAAVAGDVERCAVFRRLEVARFVEDVVGGEECFVDFANGVSALEDCGGVAKGATMARVHIHVADKQRDVSGLRVEGFERGYIARDELALKQQILRRVAGQGEFGGEHDFRAARDKITVGGEDFRGVPGEVADDWIDLCEANAHCVRRRYDRERAAGE